MNAEDIADSLMTDLIRDRPGFTAGQYVRLAAHSMGMSFKEASDSISRLMRAGKVTLQKDESLKVRDE